MATGQWMAEVERVVGACEEMYFTGWFSESVIKDDLQKRKTRDSLSTMGSNPRQTYHLSEKKQFYLKDFDDVEKRLNEFLDGLPRTHELYKRSERCKNQIIKLREIVRNF